MLTIIGLIVYIPSVNVIAVISFLYVYLVDLLVRVCELYSAHNTHYTYIELGVCVSFIKIGDACSQISCEILCRTVPEKETLYECTRYLHILTHSCT